MAIDGPAEAGHYESARHTTYGPAEAGHTRPRLGPHDVTLGPHVTPRPYDVVSGFSRTRTAGAYRGAERTRIVMREARPGAW